MPLNHFKAKHFGAKSLSLLGHIGAAVNALLDYIGFARRVGRR
jgi:hypothetical protein